MSLPFWETTAPSQQSGKEIGLVNGKGTEEKEC